MNIKEGIKRIFLAFGYLFFALIGWGIAENEGSFIITIIGIVLGFYTFKGLLIGINWIIAGFKN